MKKGTSPVYPTAENNLGESSPKTLLTVGGALFCCWKNPIFFLPNYGESFSSEIQI
jgi:hypothetical protein